MIDIRGFLETSLLDWDGRISSVIFLPGCNFRCAFCHNHLLVFHPEELKRFAPQDIKKYLAEHKNWIDGVVISGGEPTLYGDLEDFIRELKDMGFAIKLDTNGSRPAVIEKLIKERLVDYIAMDVKGPLDQRYESIVGCRVDLDDIRRSIRAVIDGGVDHEFRTTVVPGLLTADDISEIASVLAGAKRFILQQFVPSNAMEERLRSVTPYAKEALLEMAEQAKRFVPNTIVRGA